MIQQTSFSPVAMPAGNPATTTSKPSGHWAGTGVTLVSGVRKMFKSLDPRYIPEHLQQPGQQVEYPSFSDTQAGQNNGFFQGMELAARLTSHALLPAEVSTFIGGLVNLSATVRLVNNALDTPKSNTRPEPDLSVKVDKQEDNTRDKQPPTKKPAKAQPTIAHQAGQARKALALGVLSSLVGTSTAVYVPVSRPVSAPSLADAGAAPTTGNPSDSFQEIGDAAALAKIGRDNEYPPNGNYRQTADIDARNLTQSIANNTHPFTGQYDGQCHTIDNLDRCLFQAVGNPGRVSNLRFTNANITTSELPAVVVSELSGAVDHILVENSIVAPSTAMTARRVGIIAGEISRTGTVACIKVVNNQVSTKHPRAWTGIVGGAIYGSVTQTTAVNNTLSTEAEAANAGIVAGVIDQYLQYRSHEKKVINHSGSVTQTTAVNNTVSTKGRRANAGIVAGVVEYGGLVNQTTAVGNTVSTGGSQSAAGIGSGLNYGNVTHTMAVNNTVTTSGYFGYAGIGGGDIRGSVNDTTAVDNTVTTRGSGAHAGIGGGSIFRSGSVTRTVAMDNKLSTMGKNANADIGAGRVDGSITHTTAENITVNDKIRHAGNYSTLTRSNLCDTANPLVLTGDCQFSISYPEAFNSNVCPVSTETTPALPETTTKLAETAAMAETTALTEITPTLAGAIPVGDAETLFKIGRDVNYPLNGTYQQTADIDARNQTQSIGNTTHPFTGQYQGQCNTIENLNRCLINRLDGNGTVSNVRFNQAHVINSRKPAAVIACTMDGNAQIKYARIDNSLAATATNNELYEAHAGLGTGNQKSRNNRIIDLAIENSKVRTWGPECSAGGAAGRAEGQISGTLARHTQVITRGRAATAAIGAGRISGQSEIKDTRVVNCSVATRGSHADTGLAVGRVNGHGKVDGTIAAESRVISHGSKAHTGVAAGSVYDNGEVNNTLSTGNHITTRGHGADAAVGAGQIKDQGSVQNTLAMECYVKTRRSAADAGIGAGVVSNNGQLTNTVALASSVTTRGAGAHAGIGAGFVLDNGKVDNTSSCQSVVNAPGVNSSAGIGAGLNSEQGLVENTHSFNSSVKGFNADIPVGRTNYYARTLNTTIVNSTVNGELKPADASPHSLGINPDQLCKRINDQSFIAEDCQINPAGLYAVPHHHQGHGSNSRVEALSVNVAPHKATSLSLLAGTAAPMVMIGIATATGAALGVYSSYHYFKGYREGQRGWELAARPLTKGTELLKNLVMPCNHGEKKLAKPDDQMPQTTKPDGGIEHPDPKKASLMS